MTNKYPGFRVPIKYAVKMKERDPHTEGYALQILSMMPRYPSNILVWFRWQRNVAVEAHIFNNRTKAVTSSTAQSNKLFLTCAVLIV